MNLLDLVDLTADSDRIAARLEARGATLCPHRQSRCFLRCGVECKVQRIGQCTLYFPPLRIRPPFLPARPAGWTYAISWPVLRKLGPWRAVPKSERLIWAAKADERGAAP